MLEGHPRIVRRERESSPRIGAEGADTILLRIESVDADLDAQITEKYGVGFMKDVGKALAQKWEDLLMRADDLIDRAEKKGLLPQSKLGMRILATMSGTVGAMPGLPTFPLLGVAYILWRRSKKI